YATKDERVIALSGIQTEGHFEEFCTLIGRSDLLDDPRFATSTARLANAAACVETLDAVFADRTLAEWVEVLSKLSTPWTVVQTAAEAAVDPQVTANGYVTTVEGSTRAYPLVASPAQFDETAPGLTPAPGHAE